MSGLGPVSAWENPLLDVGAWALKNEGISSFLFLATLHLPFLLRVSYCPPFFLPLFQSGPPYCTLNEDGKKGSSSDASGRSDDGRRHGRVAKLE